MGGDSAHRLPLGVLWGRLGKHVFDIVGGLWGPLGSTETRQFPALSECLRDALGPGGLFSTVLAILSFEIRVRQLGDALT